MARALTGWRRWAMRNTALVKRRPGGAIVTAIVALMVAGSSPVQAEDSSTAASQEHRVVNAEPTLSAKQQAIPLIAAFMASSNMPKLHAALNQGLDAGLTISEAKENLVHLYAYTGFPRSLNALGELL